MTEHPLAAVTSRVPHRHPMLLLDRIEQLEAGEHAIASKLVTVGETWQEGAASTEANGFPPSLLIDALGQVAIAALSAETADARVWYLASLEALTIASAAHAGERILMEARLGRSWRGTSRVAVRASVDDRELISGTMVLAPGTRQEEEKEGEQ